MKKSLLVLAAAVAVTVWGETAKLKVGMYLGRGGRSNGAATWVRMLATAPEVEMSWLEGDDVRAGKLVGLDMVVMPGGSSDAQAESLGQEGRERIREYLRQGGTYFGTCAGCSIVQDKKGFLRLLPYRKRVTVRRGGCMIGTDFLPEAESLMGLKAGVRKMTYHGGPLFEATNPTNVPDCHDLKILARYAGSICESSKKPENFPMQGRPAMITAGYGKGKFVVTSFHPEHYPLTRDVIVAGVRYLTGRTITLQTPIKPRNSLRVGYYTPAAMGRVSYLPILDLDRISNVDVYLVDAEFIERGEMSHLDVLVVPEGDVKHVSRKNLLNAFRKEQISAFAARGGVVLSWGQMAKLVVPGTRVVADAQAMVSTVKTLATK